MNHKSVNATRHEKMDKQTKCSLGFLIAAGILFVPAVTISVLFNFGVLTLVAMLWDLAVFGLLFISWLFALFSITKSRLSFWLVIGEIPLLLYIALFFYAFGASGEGILVM